MGDYGTESESDIFIWSLRGNGLRERTTHCGDFIGCNLTIATGLFIFTVSCLLSFVEKVDCRS